LVLKLDQANHTATVAAQFGHGANFDADYMGSVEPLSNGNEFVGWGSRPYISEYSPSGQMLLDAYLPYPDLSYRARVEPWVGLPLYPPSGAARRSHGRTTVYASWNGATQVASWRVLAGSGEGALRVAATKPRSGFETAIPVAGPSTAFRLQALDARGRVIGTSREFRVG
jgi:hypothetical protein